MRRVVMVGFVLLSLGVFVAGVQAQRIAPSPDAPLKTASQVEVINFPAVQAVTGAVHVSNLPLDGDGNVRVAGTLTLAAPPAAAVRFAGYSVATFAEGTGLLTLNRACDAEFPGSVTCRGMDLARMAPPPVGAVGMLISVETTREIQFGEAIVPISTCMGAAGVVFDCGGSTLPVIACCAY